MTDDCRSRAELVSAYLEITASEWNVAMPRIVLPVVCLLVFVLAAAGCEQNSATEIAPSDVTPAEPIVDPAKSVQPVDDAGSDGSDSAVAVELKIATFEELQASITSSKGKIVVVDYWSTSCPPCMTEFPDLIAIHNEIPHDQVRCVSASLDYDGLPDYPIEDCRKSALEFLERTKSTLDNFILSDESLTVMDDKLKIASIPAVFVFDADGKLARQFDESSGESFTYEKDITPFVNSLVSQRFPATPASAEDE
ncbi:MAG: TlpA disulfide reductase family protein [Planctomycetales bacterium]|jgi:thiol-disulfide isomerase/thioredoxin